MMEIWTDGEKEGEARLVDGKLKVSGNIQMYIDDLRWGWGTETDLTDEEVYHSLPFRLRDRTDVKFTGGEKLSDHEAAWEKISKAQDAAQETAYAERWGRAPAKEEAPKPMAGLLGREGIADE